MWRRSFHDNRAAARADTLGRSRRVTGTVATLLVRAYGRGRRQRASERASESVAIGAVIGRLDALEQAREAVGQASGPSVSSPARNLRSGTWDSQEKPRWSSVTVFIIPTTWPRSLMRPPGWARACQGRLARRCSTGRRASCRPRRRGGPPPWPRLLSSERSVGGGCRGRRGAAAPAHAVERPTEYIAAQLADMPAAALTPG